MSQQKEKTQPKPLNKKFFIILTSITLGSFIILVTAILSMNKLISQVPHEKAADNLILLAAGEDARLQTKEKVSHAKPRDDEEMIIPMQVNATIVTDFFQPPSIRS